MKSSRKILLSVVALIISVIAATTTTFAWFTTNSQVSTGEITAGVTDSGADLILLSTADASDNLYGTYGKNVSANQIAASIANASIVTTIPESPVAGTYYYIGATDKLYLGVQVGESVNATEKTAQEVIDAKVQLAPATLYNGTSYAYGNGLKEMGAINTYTQAAPAGSYIEFKLSFQSNADVKIGLVNDNTNGVSATADKSYLLSKADNRPAKIDAVAWKTDATTYGTAISYGTTMATRASNAVRVSFTSGATTKIWNPNYKGGFYKENLAKDYYEYITKDTFNTIPSKADLLTETIGLKGVKSVATERVEIAAGTADNLVTWGSANQAGVRTSTMTVRIWVEGFDGDCFNYIMSDTISAVFQFATFTEAA